MSVERQFGQLLIDKGLLSADRAGQLLAEAEEKSLPLARLVVEDGVDPADALRAVAAHLRVEFFEGDGSPEPAALERIDAAIATANAALPIRIEGESLIVAVEDPLDGRKRAALRQSSGMEVSQVLAHRPALASALKRQYGEEPGPTVVTEAEGDGPEVLHINDLLRLVLDMGGSDLHLTSGSPPQVRVNGSLVLLESMEPMRPEPLRQMVYSVLTGRQREQLENEMELDCSHPVPGRARFRMNVFFQRGSVGAVLRAIPDHVKEPAELGLPPAVGDFAWLTRGLVLVTGPTGSGKSTTLASIIDSINRNRALHIMTIEDPIEFLHRHERSLVNQREVGSDTKGFARALRQALRQDPDVVMVGEMRDLETIATALTAAETGHVVFGTLHTQDAARSVERIIDVFPSHQQTQVRVQLAGSLQGVVSQQLLPTTDGKSRVAAVEVMVATPAVRNLVREGKVHQIQNAMQAGGEHGMQTMDQSLASLVRRGLVSRTVAAERAIDINAFFDLLGRGS
jgi:twitching motility protein PilT